MRVLIFGNSGSGKTTLARRLSTEHALRLLDLDTLTWSEPAVRRPLHESYALVDDFVAAHRRWVIEGCYGDLIEHASRDATKLIFLNPGVDACVANCLARPWEPHKYGSREEQDAWLGTLLEWVGQYESRRDEFSLARHRLIFDAFAGEKIEIRANA